MISLHNHTHFSNFRLLDAMIKPSNLIKQAIKIGLDGVAITDHETVSAHIEAIQTVKEINKLYKIYTNEIVQTSIENKTNLKNKEALKRISELTDYSVDDLEKMVKNIDLLKNMTHEFKLVLGNEIYLMDEEKALPEAYEGGGKTKFYHFILLAKNSEGHKQIRELSSKAWENSFWAGNMERVPTYKCDVEKIIKGGNVVASTACLGSEFAQLIIQVLEAQNLKDEITVRAKKKEIHNFITWCINVFGKENFFIEIQPSNLKDTLAEAKEAEKLLENASSDKEIKRVNAIIEQKYRSYANAEVQAEYNKMAVTIAKAYGLDWIVTTDSHYLTKKDRKVHSAFLNSKDGDRETNDFYATTYLMSQEEIAWHIDYLKESDIQEAFDNTMKIDSMIENYDLHQPVTVPRMELPEFHVRHIFKRGYEQFPYIANFANSDDEQDRYLLRLVEDGFKKKVPYSVMSKETFYMHIDRINQEFAELWEITKEINTKISSYYVTTREIINIMWEEGDSFVGVARGSVTGFFIAYLIDITQLNPIEWNLPHWRHLTRTRPELPDIDIDSQQSRRKTILEALKRKFGERRVLPICTFGTEGSRSSLITACRGLGIDNDTAQYLADFIPFERGSNWSLADCLEGDDEKGRRPIKEFINEINSYENLLETALAIEGLVTKRSIHASGVYVFADDFVLQNARMKAPNGTFITQWNMGDSDYCGGLKVDLLTIQALDKIRTCMDLLISDGYMEWKGTLRDTYNAYIHPDVLDYKTPEMWDMIGKNEIIDLFQFDTEVGLNSAQKVKPRNMFELAVTNSLMRLMAEAGEEQPVDTYVKFKNNISLWYEEMRDYGLSEEEIKVLEKHLKSVFGVADTQEVVMQLSMDKNISAFDLKQANKLRKGIAKKKGGVQDEAKKMYYRCGEEAGTTMTLLNYVWNVQIRRQLGYSFSINHTTPYSCIAVQEMNLAYHYPIIYWNTACLTINAGADEENEDNKGTDYGKIAVAIGNMQQRGINIALPDINEANFGFKPDIDNNQIVFGLKGINGIGDEVVQTIISNRPYDSFEDFYDRMGTPKPTGTVDNKGKPIMIPSLVKTNQTVQLIKAGCFDNLEDMSREDVMKKFIEKICEPKKQLTFANVPMLMKLGLIPNELNYFIRIMDFKKYLAKKVHSEIANNNQKTKKKYADRLLLVDLKCKDFFDKYFSTDCIVSYELSGYLVSENKFEKEYTKLMDKFKEWITLPSTLDTLNSELFNESWSDRCSGTLSAWEMDALSFYYHNHELINVDKEKYGIVDFIDLPEVPEVAGSYYRGGKQRFKFKLDRIVGTVLDRDKHKHTVILLTPTGVVTVKMYDGAFQHYDKQLSKSNGDGTKSVVEKSWFTRGNMLMIGGFRSGTQFRPYKYVDSVFQHTVALIEDMYEDGSLDLKLERESID